MNCKLYTIIILKYLNYYTKFNSSYLYIIDYRRYQINKYD